MASVLESVLVKQLVNQQLLNVTDLDLLQKVSGYYLTTALALISEKILTPQQLSDFCCSTLNITQIQASTLQVSRTAFIDKHWDFIQENQVLPIHLQTKSVTLATADPFHYSIKSSFEFNTGLHVDVVYCCPLSLQHYILKLSSCQLDVLATKPAKSVTAFEVNSNKVKEGKHLKTLDNDFETSRLPVSAKRAVDMPKNTPDKDEPVILYVNQMLSLAIKQGASDLHFEPYKEQFRLRLRIDGVLLNVDSSGVIDSQARKAVKQISYLRVAARLKIMAQMDIAEKRKPQDGRLKFISAVGNEIEFRASTLPTIWGEKVVLRLLNNQTCITDINQLGFSSKQLTQFVEVLTRSQGLILVTGPTGSGKTLSLYSGLHFLNGEDKNISTIEDPVEQYVHGINQVQVNHKAQLDFANSLRAFLRQDPDVVMVGEIRDLETAEIAIKAAQTGHLVLSTLHTNSASETLNRLANMGVATYNLASAISLIIAQRLVRCLCSYCKKPAPDLSELELDRLGISAADLTDIKLYTAVGCSKCHQGYKGRTAIFELLIPNEPMRLFLLQQPNSLAIQQHAEQAGMVSLRQAGIQKVLSGDTSLEEVNRVIGH